jgi:chromosome segregation protein
MGNINMAAPEEYEALAEKQRFLIEQINDLLKAKDDLMAAITKINGATRENFRQTFHDVREHFRRLYGVLFEGGEADLILTDPENMLETGVDIVAQPPGKKLQSISLLSGGEKTLTAIALLFAFFMVKPSPFCMLDEADAALDDANIERFAAILREFQNKTQFLIVSHNKRTMEAADVMYGVTMEQKGISQLISVDFRKKAALPEREAHSLKVDIQGPYAAPEPVAAAPEPAAEAPSPDDNEGQALT